MPCFTRLSPLFVLPFPLPFLLGTYLLDRGVVEKLGRRHGGHSAHSRAASSGSQRRQAGARLEEGEAADGGAHSVDKVGEGEIVFVCSARALFEPVSGAPHGENRPSATMKKMTVSKQVILASWCAFGVCRRPLVALQARAPHAKTQPTFLSSSATGLGH